MFFVCDCNWTYGSEMAASALDTTALADSVLPNNVALSILAGGSCWFASVFAGMVACAQATMTACAITTNMSGVSQLLLLSCLTQSAYMYNIRGPVPSSSDLGSWQHALIQHSPYPPVQPAARSARITMSMQQTTCPICRSLWQIGTSNAFRLTKLWVMSMHTDL